MEKEYSITIYSILNLKEGGNDMATAKQIELRIKYAKMTINSLTKKINMAKARVKKLEGEMKKAKVAAQKTAKKSPARKKAASKRKC